MPSGQPYGLLTVEMGLGRGPVKFLRERADDGVMEAVRSVKRVLRKTERGFTLPEVMITIVLLGIVLAIASSTWFGLVERRAVDSAANQLAADMRLAHSSATNQLASWRIVYDDTGDTFACGSVADADYCLLRLDGSTVARTIPRSLPDNTRIRETSLAGVLPLPGFVYNRSVEFRADGSAQAMGGLVAGATAPTITVSAEDNDPSHVLEVTPGTSRVRVD